MIHRSKFFDNIGQLLNNYPDIDLRDLFSKGQMESKKWLVDELIKLNLDLKTIFLCAGWYGSLATFLFESGISLDKIRSFDVNPSCANIADTFNRSWVNNSWQFKAITQDIFDIDYNEHMWQCWSNSNNRMSYPITDKPDTIINTSCEHIKDFTAWYNKIPKDKLIVLQSNNYFEVSDHVNCSENLLEFSLTCPMSNVLYEGKLELPKYDRFMKIGFK